MAIPSSPTRRQTGFELPETSQINSEYEYSYSTRSRNDTSSTITQHAHNPHDKEESSSQVLQPLPIPGTTTATFTTILTSSNHQSSQSPSELPTPPDTHSAINLEFQSSSTSSQPHPALALVNGQEIFKSNQILSINEPDVQLQILPIRPNQNQPYPPSSTSSSGPASLSSSAGFNSLNPINSRNLQSFNQYSNSNHSLSNSQPRNSFGFGYSSYSTKSSGFKTSAERGALSREKNEQLLKDSNQLRAGAQGTPERNSNLTRMIEGEGTGDSAGVFSFSSPNFGPQSIADEDIDLEEDISNHRQVEDLKSPGWAAITLGQLSLGSPDVSSSTSPHPNGPSTTRSSVMMNLSSSQGGGPSSSTSRRYPPNSSSISSSRPNNNNNSRIHSHGPSSFNSGSPASRSLPSADAAIHAAAMHRRASYNRTASGAQRPSLVQLQSGGGSSNSRSFNASSFGLSPASPSPIGMSTSSNGNGRSRQSVGLNTRRTDRSRSRNRYTTRTRNNNAIKSHDDVEFDEDATNDDDDEMALDINDEDDDDTEDELLDQDHSGSIAGSNIESSVIGEMDTDLEMDESDIGSNYGGGDNKRMEDPRIGWDVNNINDDGSSRSLSGYYTSTRGEYVSPNPNGNGSLIGKNQTSNSSSSRPYLLDKVGKSSSGTSPSLGLSFNNSIDSTKHSGNNMMITSFGTSPSSVGRHHPYNNNYRSNFNSGSPSSSRSIGNQNGINITTTNHQNLENDEISSNSLPTRIGIGVSPLGKNQQSSNTINKKRRGVDKDRRNQKDESIGGKEDSSERGLEIDDDEDITKLDEDFRKKVKELNVNGNNNNNKTIRKSNLNNRRSSFKETNRDLDSTNQKSILSTRRSSSSNHSTSGLNPTLKDLESIISTTNHLKQDEQQSFTILGSKFLKESTSTSNCSAFISKLWHLMSNPEKYSQYITWSTSGDSIILFNQAEKQDVFAKEILPKLFKHGNVASFVRQLNLYGFQRVPTSRSLDSAEQELAISQATEFSKQSKPKISSIATNAGNFYGSHSAFVHPNFFKNGKDKLSSMKPRSSKGNKKSKDSNGNSEGMESLSSENHLNSNPTSSKKKHVGNGDVEPNGIGITNANANGNVNLIVNNDQDEETDDEDDLAFD